MTRVCEVIVGGEIEWFWQPSMLPVSEYSVQAEIGRLGEPSMHRPS